MKKLRNLALFVSVFFAVCMIFGGRAHAGVAYTGASYAPSGYRTTCTAGTPVDFTAYASNANLNTSTGVVTYTVNVRWGTCTATPTRAYAVYGDSSVCPLAGYYGAGPGGLAYDCVKYIGDPAYNNPGSSLTCAYGTNEDCVTSVFSGARRVANNPPVWAYDSVSIPMSFAIPGWNPNPTSGGSRTISSNMCQYYKTGTNFTVNNDDRCINVGLTVSWQATGTIYTTKYYPANKELGNTSGQPAVVNNANVCLRNKNNVEFACNTANPWSQSGIWVGDNNYSVRVAVPAGYSLERATSRGANASITCDGANNTGTCRVTTFVVAGQTSFVDFFFGKRPEGWLDAANCTTVSGWARDPDALNTAINVKVYIDALPGFGGRLIGTFPANIAREPAVGNHGFSVNISSYRDAYGHNIYVYAVDSQTGAEIALSGSPKAIVGAPCAPPDCSVAASPSPAATGAQFNMTLSYTYSPGSNGMRISPLGLARAEYPGSPSETEPERYTFPLSLAGNSHVFDGSDGTPPDGEYRYGNPGTYALYGRIRYSSTQLDQSYDRTCGNDLDIAGQPYFKVWENDVQVGGGFQGSDGTCAVVEDQATVIGYGGDGMTNRFRGSSTEYGLSSLGEVRNFFSAAQRSPRTSTKSAWPVPPHGLTFANSQVDGVPFGAVDPADANKVANYGGRGEMPSCTQDWFATMPDGLTPISNNSMDVDTVSGAVHNTATGTVTIGGGNVGGPRSIFLPNASSVVITGNISASDGASLYVITNGDIKISSNVRNIDAALITTKTLYTCTNSNGSLLTSAQLFEWCGGLSADGLSGKLVVRGAVIANQIKLQRTYGTLSASDENEKYASGPAGNWAAEEFIFDPTLYSADPALKQPPRAKTQIDFITSLPPIL